MKILIGIIIFIMGYILGVFTKNILTKILEINNRIKQAEKIIDKYNKEQKFKEKYDFFKEVENDGTNERNN